MRKYSPSSLVKNTKSLRCDGFEKKEETPFLASTVNLYHEYDLSPVTVDCVPMILPSLRSASVNMIVESQSFQKSLSNVSFALYDAT